MVGVIIRLESKKAENTSMITKPAVQIIDCGETKRLKREDETLAKLWKQATPFNEEALECPNPMASIVVKKGILYSRVGMEFCKQLVVPRVKRTEVLCLAHEELLNALMGIEKTTARVTYDFYWPGVTADVRRYVLSCD